MPKLKWAALAAAAVIAPATADAATFVRYSIETVGTGTERTLTFDPFTTTFTSLTNLVFEFVANITDTIQTPVSEQVFGGGTGVFDRSSYSASAAGNVLTLSDGTPFEIRPGSGSFVTTACSFGVGASLPRDSFGVVNCGGVNLTYQGSSGYQANYAGVAQLVTATVFEAADTRTGLVSFAPGVPEPSTWALMLSGFGLVGYAMRRRARVVFA